MRAGLVLALTLWGAITSGCVAAGSRMGGGHAVRAMTSVDTSWQRLAFERQHGGCVEDATGPDLARIVGRLTDHNWSGPVVRTHVLSSDRPNAYVLESGHMYFTVALLELACTEDELAAVVAHELAHLEDSSGFNGTSLGIADRLGVEAEADRRAAVRLIDAWYEPAALLTMIQRLADEQPKGWALYRRKQLEALLGELHAPLHASALGEFRVGVQHGVTDDRHDGGS